MQKCDNLAFKSKFYQCFVFTNKLNYSTDLSHFASVESLGIAYLYKKLVTIKHFLLKSFGGQNV